MNANAILLINLSGSIIGGAQRRYISLFNHISKNKKKYYLIINDNLYRNALKNDVINENQNILQIHIPGTHKSSVKSTQTVKKQISKKNGSKHLSVVKKKINKYRGFVRHVVQWLNFVYKFWIIYRKYKFETVYAVWIGGIWIWPLKYFLKFKLIYSYNDASVFLISNSYWDFFNSEYWVIRNANKIDLLSEGIKPKLIKKIKNINENKFLVTPNSFIDYTNFYPELSKENWVIFLSRLTELKNPILFLQAVKILNEEYVSNVKTEFFVLGSGRLSYEIESYININHLNNVKYMGEINDPWTYLRRSKIFVSIQKDNNYPSQSLIEAMACENAIIASDVGETYKLVTEKEGILVKLDAKDIADALFYLIENNLECKIKGANARKKVLKEHTIENYAEYFYSIMN